LIVRWEGGEPPPAIVLLDLKLRGMAWRCCGIKSHPVFGRSVVVLHDLRRRQTCRRPISRSEPYIVKPVDFDTFVDVAAQIDLY
jgi:hypothetical protein